MLIKKKIQADSWQYFYEGVEKEKLSRLFILFPLKYHFFEVYFPYVN